MARNPVDMLRIAQGGVPGNPMNLYGKEPRQISRSSYYGDVGMPGVVTGMQMVRTTPAIHGGPGRFAAAAEIDQGDFQTSQLLDPKRPGGGGKHPLLSSSGGMNTGFRWKNQLGSRMPSDSRRPTL